MVAAVFKNLQRPEPLHGFTVGIEDDLVLPLTFLSVKMHDSGLSFDLFWLDLDS